MSDETWEQFEARRKAEGPTWEELDSGRPPKAKPEDYRAAAEFLGIGRQEAAGTAGSGLAELLFQIYQGQVHRTLRWSDLDPQSRECWEMDANAVRGYLVNVEGWKKP